MPFDNPRDFSEQQLLDKEIKDMEKHPEAFGRTVFQALTSDMNWLANTLVYFYEPNKTYRIAGYPTKDSAGKELDFPDRQSAVNVALVWLNSEAPVKF